MSDGSRADRLRRRRQQQREQSDSESSSRPNETDETTELDDPDEPSKRSEPTKTDKTSKPEKPDETADPTDSRSDSSDGSVKDERVGTYMYLPEELRRELDFAFKEIGLSYERQFGRELEKNRHFYPLVVRAGLERLADLEAEEIDAELELPR